MHELKTPLLNLKDMHLPMTPLDQVAAKAAEYRAAGFNLTAAGNITFAADTMRTCAKVRVPEGGGNSHRGVRADPCEPSPPGEVR